MSQQEQEFDTRPLADGLRGLAGQAADAPGLFEAVAAGVRRRSARVRASGTVLAVASVLAVAGGVAAWPSSSGPDGAATVARSNAFIAAAHCPAQSPDDVRTSGPADRLFTGTPAAATLCIYGITETGIKLHPESITGADLRKLTHDLAHGKSAETATCTLQRINPEHLLILQYADGSTQDLVIDLSGCGTVGTGKRAVVLPNELRQRIMAG